MARLRIAILDDYQNVALQMADWSRLGTDADVTVFDRALPSLEAQAEALAPFDVLCLMRERMPVPAELLNRLPNLKLLVVTGVRTRSIDFATAAARGIAICHTRGGDSNFSTPELAWGLILACARHIPQEHANVRDGGWQRTLGTTLEGRSLGLVGLGKMGSRMAAIGRAFGMQVIAWSQNLTAERADAAGVELVTKDQLFERADVVSLHLVLSDRTRGVVSAPELARLRPGSILVNTSRGPLVDEAALIARLDAGGLRAGLDVFDQEPLLADHPLRRRDDVVLTPHLGYVTDTTYRQFFADCVEDIIAWRDGTPVRLLTE
ncbi:2-hydroxyacid dehydrogenase [Azorhizobium oxalatiphilum]|uniref:2-hydroxyacid dehydrogenase n=1 Tax=Azorhizobium oxalatiphilum TaxID=980631 RepID=A0A917CB98_9HYPH|nr:D-2-hydroxyacid dehydrogenase family protein [Azorhizobium oxalatiphilum]GGF82538.1 2-hydroxyacid dehydrogenase [Azorhizobium oxalatiphilum]